MPVAEAHPSVEDLAAFTLGTLDDETQVAIEDHVAACTSCQERAAVAPDDTLVELLRRVHSRGADTFVEPTVQLETPVPLLMKESRFLLPSRRPRLPIRTVRRRPTPSHRNWRATRATASCDASVRAAWGWCTRPSISSCNGPSR